MTDVIAALAAIISASIFSTGFLSVRLHGNLRDAQTRLTSIEDSIRSGQTVTESATWRTLADLREAAEPDQVARWMIALNVALASGAVALTTLATIEANWELESFVALTLLAVFEVLIVLLGIADIQHVKQKASFATLFGSVLEQARKGEERLHQAWYEQGLGECREGLDEAPLWPPLNVVAGRLHLAYALTTLSKYASANNDFHVRWGRHRFERATASPDRQAAFWRAEFHLRLGELVDAAQWYRQAAEEDTEPYASWHNLGVLAFLDGQLDHARQLFRDALDTYQFWTNAATLKRFSFTQHCQAVLARTEGNETEATRLDRVAWSNWSNADRYLAPLIQPAWVRPMLLLFHPLAGVDTPKPPSLDHAPDPSHTHFDGLDEPPWVVPHFSTVGLTADQLLLSTLANPDKYRQQIAQRQGERVWYWPDEIPPKGPGAGDHSRA